jgi:hypothetical protein
MASTRPSIPYAHERIHQPVPTTAPAQRANAIVLPRTVIRRRVKMKWSSKKTARRVEK